MYPLPRIEDIKDTLGEAQYFSTLDLAAGYWQIELDPATREKSACHHPPRVIRVQPDAFWLVQRPLYLPTPDASCLGWFGVGVLFRVYR